MARRAEGAGALSGERLVDRARDVLEANWTGTATVPSRSLYPHQWSWDSAYIAMGLAHVEQGRAQTELETLFAAQWDDGRVPHIVFNRDVPAEQYFPGPAFWRSETAAAAPRGVATSGIVQPPLHARAALEVHRHAADGIEARRFLERLYPALAAQHAYLAEHRDAVGDGLAAVVHPWETGLDNAPLWDEALARMELGPGDVEPYTRRDLEHAPAADRPSDAEYDRYVHLAASYRDAGYRDADWLPRSPFALEDPLFNAVYLWSERALADIARLVGADAAAHDEAAARIRAGLLRRLLDYGTGRFGAMDLRAGRVGRRTVGCLVPLVDADLPAAVAGGLAADLRSGHFAPAGGFRVPTNDVLARDFDPRRYWRGPVWVNTNWLLWRGLLAHGFERDAAAVVASTVALVERSGFREYFNPLTGEGHGTHDFSWTAALLLDMLAS